MAESCLPFPTSESSSSPHPLQTPLSLSSSRALWLWLVMVQLVSWCTMIAGTEIRLGLLSPFQDELHGWDINAAGATMAVEKAKKDGLLPGVDVQFYWEDDNCSALDGAGKTVLLRYNFSVDAFIGPPCSASTTSAGLLASYWNMPMFSQSSLDPSLADRTTYSTLVRLKPSFNAMGSALVHIFHYFNWKRVVMITGRRERDKNVFCDYSTHASAESFVAENITIGDRIIIDDDPSDDEVDEVLYRLRQRGRIVALCTENPEVKRRILVRAQKVDMNHGNYVIIMTDLSSFVTLNTSWFVKEPPYYDYDHRGHVHVFQITVAQLSGQEVDDFRDEVPRKMAEPPWNYNGTLLKGKRGSESSPYLHDAVYLYLLLLNKSLETGMDYADGRAMFRRATKQTFIGITGNVTLDENGDRLPDYWLWSASPGDDVFEVRIIASMANEPSQVVSIARPIQWNSHSGETPQDSPACGFEEELCQSDPSSTDFTLVFSVAGAIVFIAIMIAVWGYFYRRRLLLEKGLELMLWKITYEDICFIKKTRTNSVCQTGTGSLLSGGTASFPTPASTGSDSTVGAEGTHSSMVGLYRGQTVAIRKVNLTDVSFGRAEQLHLNMLKELNHENVLPFMGLCLDERFPCILTAYCAKGTLQSIIENEDIQLDWMFKVSLTADLVNGMSYIHNSPLHYHGRLNSSTCLVDNRWTLKVADFGFHSCLSGLWQPEVDDQQPKDLLWAAPEVLRKSTEAVSTMTETDWQKADVFSFSIVLFELLYRSHPYDTYLLSPADVIQRIKNGETPPFRPPVPNAMTVAKGPSDIPDIVLILMQKCWSECPHDRPLFHSIKTTVAGFTKGRKTGIVDNMLKMLEKYANNLEDIVDQRTKELVEERKKSDLLLYRMLPRVVAEKLKAGNNVPPELYESVTVYFSDIVDFTVLSSESTPMEIVDLLNDLYTDFDSIVSLHDVYKMETIGDAYMVVSGVPERNENRHVSEIANLALDLLSSVSSFRIKHRPGMQLSLRIGIHTGSCAAGVVGRTMPRYCLFGDTVNMASRMESTGLPLTIQVSQRTKECLEEIGGYLLTYRGTIVVKGKGEQSTYWLKGREGSSKPLPRYGSPAED